MRKMKKWIPLIASAIMVAGSALSVNAAAYGDVNPGDWHYDYVNYVSDQGIMSGYSHNGCFGPADKLTRGQFATILYRMSGSPETAFDGHFPDVAGGEFYSDPVTWAYQNNVITGYSSNGCFGPNDNITREQMATIFYRYAPIAGKDTNNRGDLNAYPDGGSVSGFAADGMSYAVGTGLISGDNGNLKPQGNAERAQCAAIIKRFMESADVNQGGNTNPGGGDTNNGQNPDGEYGSPDEPQQPTDLQKELAAWADRNGWVSHNTLGGYVKTIDNVIYNAGNDGEKLDIWVADGSQASGKVEIPAEFDGIPVTGIGYGAFVGNANITEVVIPASVTRVNESAFNQCDGIKSMTFRGDAPEGAAHMYGFYDFTLNYPKNAKGWDEVVNSTEYEFANVTFVAY